MNDEDTNNVVLMAINNLRIDLEAARREMRGKARRHDAGLACVKKQGEAYIAIHKPLLTELLDKRQVARDRTNTVIKASLVFIVLGSLSFVGYAIWDKVKLMVAG